MTVGYLQKEIGDEVKFEVSEKTVLTLSNWKWSGSARYSTHQRHNHHALTEYVGIDPDKITFDITMVAELGVNPMDLIWKLFDYEREGAILALTVGKHGYGKYRWNIVSHDTDIKFTTRDGDITAATITLTLQEYLRQ